jgi:hypothetical protein
VAAALALASSLVWAGWLPTARDMMEMLWDAFMVD